MSTKTTFAYLMVERDDGGNFLSARVSESKALGQVMYLANADTYEQAKQILLDDLRFFRDNLSPGNNFDQMVQRLAESGVEL